ncbi:MAG TPA: Kazal-type serine protease inhibitor domain-containing protein [Polyangiaceae bacterium]
MRAPSLSFGGWIASACLVGGTLWACSSDETDPFSNPSRGGASGASGNETGGSETGGTSGSSSGSTTGGSAAGGASGSNTGGDGTGGTPAGGTTGDGGAAAESGNDSGGTATGGTATGGTATGGAGMGGAGMSGAGVGGAGTAGMGGAGMGGAGKGGKGGGGMPGDCADDDDCESNAYCQKATCDAAKGTCRPLGPECRGAMAEFEPVCGCDHITYWNTCVIEHEGINIAATGECTGSSRPTCTRDEGGESCPSRSHARCYRPVDVCGDTSPTTGVCWVLPSECPDDEPQTTRYCGGTAGSARCIGFCEVLDAENSFRRDASQCN